MSSHLGQCQVDPNITGLVGALNAFPGIRTTSSCGGHESPRPGQCGPGEWQINFRVAQDTAGWRSLEFLAWLINNDWRRSDRRLVLFPWSPPPYLDEPGECLSFVLTGEGINADELAAWINETRRRAYLGPEGVEVRQ